MPKSVYPFRGSVCSGGDTKLIVAHFISLCSLLDVSTMKQADSVLSC